MVRHPKRIYTKLLQILDHLKSEKKKENIHVSDERKLNAIISYVRGY